MSDEQLVSCLCVTRNRVVMLRRAVACFLNQTYLPRELVVVYEADDLATRNYLATLSEPSIRAVEVPATPKLSLGDLRNLSLQAGRGHYVAQWDDDDWHAPTRLTEQIKAIRISSKPACVLARWLMYDESADAAYLSATRTWEGSLVAERGAVPSYAPLRQGEDTPCIERLLAAQNLVALDSPHLYVYIQHGANTWDRSHWERNLLPFAQPLSTADTEQIRTAITC